MLAKEISAKIVFYGPGLSGKTSTLRRIYETVKPAHRGELMSLPTEADRTLFFDFLPVRVEKVGDYSLRLALYTVPGQVFYNATRKLVLQGADGVVLVADSQAAAEEGNRESLANLEENLAEQGVALAGFPFVIQYNKRDLPGALPLDRMRAMLNTQGVPDLETCASNGQGVLEVLKAIVRLVVKDLRAKGVVPTSKPALPVAVTDTGAGLEGQIQKHLADELARATVEAPRSTFGPVAALAPAALLDHVKVAEATYAAGDYAACVRAAADGVRKGLAFAGDGGTGERAFLLGLDGRDVLHFEGLTRRAPPRVDDAAFALYFLMQLCLRLNTAGLPVTSQ